MRPFAHAVAKEMDPAAGGSTTVYNVYVNDARINDDPQIRAVVNDMVRVAARKRDM